MNWFVENFVTIIALAIVLFVVAIVIYNIIRDKRKGKSSCGGNCLNCSMCSKSQVQEDKKKTI